jgi:peptidoglycan/LPS O-acetylase OafA/YrhL
MKLARILVLAVGLVLIAIALLISLINPDSEQIQKIMLDATSFFSNDPKLQNSYPYFVGFSIPNEPNLQ